MRSLNIDMVECLNENTLDRLYEKHDGQFLCKLTNDQYVAGELNWEQGHAPNYYIEVDNSKYYHTAIKEICIIPEYINNLYHFLSEMVYFI